MISLIRFFFNKGLYGLFFSNSSAFSAATISQTIGLFLGSILSVYTCTNVKLYVYIGILITSLICYVILLLKHTKIENSSKKTDIIVDNDFQEEERF